MGSQPTLALPEWVVLAVLDEAPSHGFAIAALTAADGELGRVWTIPRPMIYRAIGRLQAADLIVPGAVESGRGPQRTVYRTTASGRRAVLRWLATPVHHIREVRSHLLLKLALLDRIAADPADLLHEQRAALRPIVAAITDGAPGGTGFDATLDAWRRRNATATLEFLDDLVTAHPAGRKGRSL